MCPELPQTGWPQVVQGSKVGALEVMTHCFHSVLLSTSLRLVQIQEKGAQISPFYDQCVKELTGKF